jgi:two-component sensor histidine kinase
MRVGWANLMRLVHFIGVLRRYQDKPSGYTIALIVLILALGVRELLDPYIKIPYVTLFPAMVVCSLVGGRLAGILAAGVGGIIAWYLWLSPRGTFSLEWPTAQLTILLYVLTSTILLLLTRGLDETLRELEKERDLSAELFRELQHRTANNLQNVSALLRQNRDAIRRDPSKAVDVIDSAERRFEIMSRINRRLYSPEMQEVEATPFLETLCQDILASMGNTNVFVVVSPSSIRLGREKAMLLCLIVAELLMNATKHAFDHGRPGSVLIRLEPKGAEYHLIFADDGKGLPEDSNVTTSSGLGSRIVRGLVEQMAGTIRSQSSPDGTTIEIAIAARD